MTTTFSFLPLALVALMVAACVLFSGVTHRTRKVTVATAPKTKSSGCFMVSL